MAAKLSSADLLDAFGQMTVLELAEFTEQFQETFGVTAAVPLPVPAPEPAPPAGDEPEEQDEFDVVLQAAGDKKIQVIKEVRALGKLGLKEAKDLVDAAPSVVLAQAGKDAAEQAQALLRAAGATVTIRQPPDG
jgi:large subunit ribosomal protein L7/L12